MLLNMEHDYSLYQVYEDENSMVLHLRVNCRKTVHSGLDLVLSVHLPVLPSHHSP